MKRDPHNIQFTLTDLSGAKKVYNLVPLKRKIASHVMHSCLRTVLKGLSEATKKKSAVNMSAVLKAFGEIDFDTLWFVAECLFKGAVIKADAEIISIDELDESDYFEGNPDELYIAIYHGVLENYPKVFSSVRARFAGLGQMISDQIQGQMSPQETSDTASVKTE